MKLMYIKDIDKFFQLINSCQGEVELISKEGDRLNLKSTLTQYVAREVFTGSVKDLEIIAHNPEDGMKIMKFMIGE